MTEHTYTDATDADFIRLKPRMRSLDRDILAEMGQDPEAELQASWDAAQIKKLVTIPATQNELGINLSMYPYMDEHTSLWTFLTFLSLDSERVAFVRNTRSVIRELFQFEPPQVTRACSVIPCDFIQSLRWHQRVIKSTILLQFEYMGFMHILVEMRKENF
jgi:hypothetical protein